MEWARKAYLADYKFDSPHASYNATLNHLENKVQFEVCCHKESNCQIRTGQHGSRCCCF